MSYLLIRNEGYYPSHGTGDWFGVYDTEEEATAEMSGQKAADRALEEDDVSYYIVHLGNQQVVATG